MSAHIGTSGWHYQHWKGGFYPAGLPVRKWLEYYAERFETVEINNAPSTRGPANWSTCGTPVRSHTSYFNNDAHGCAIRDAITFASAAQRAGLVPSAVPSRRGLGCFT